MKSGLGTRTAGAWQAAVAFGGALADWQCAVSRDARLCAQTDHLAHPLYPLYLDNMLYLASRQEQQLSTWSKQLAIHLA